jgi:DnaD/phage-associated family protein
MIHDFYGLPVEVLLMLIEYCVSIGKNSLSYISKAAKTWSEKEIDSIEKADEQIHILRRCDNTWKRLCELTGISTPRPTASQSNYLSHWTNELKFDIDMIYLAYEEMANHTDKISFPYMNKVLQNWYDAGIKSAADIEEAKQQRTAEKAKPAKQKKPSGYEASYDIDEFNRRSDTSPLIYKRSTQEGEE